MSFRRGGLVGKELIGKELIAKMRTWKYTGFRVYVGGNITPAACLLKREHYEADPLLCPKCHNRMKIISVIKDGKVIDKILAHLQYKFEALPLSAASCFPVDSFSAH